MRRPEISLRTYRVVAQLTLVGSVVATVAALWCALQGFWALAALAFLVGIALLAVSQFVTIRPEPGSENVLVFVTKEECALCDEARALLPTVLAGTPFRVEESPIENDRLLRRHFRKFVPVLLWQGEEIARLSWDADAVRARLAAIVAARGDPRSRQQSP